MSDESLESALNLVANFADKFAVAVEGHAREELTSEQKSQLESLARGELSDEHRPAVVELLARNEAAMEFLAKVAG